MTPRKDTSARRAIDRIFREAKARKTLLMILSCFVVFITTYVLILPAITLDQEEAARQGGIDVVTEQKAESATADAAIKYEGKGFEISASFDGEALPDGTQIEADEIGKSDDSYEKLREDALQAVRDDSGSSTCEIAFAKFYDISLISDGESIEPDGPVDVTISYDKALKVSDADNLRVVHFAVDGETGESTSEVLDSDIVSPKIKKDKMTETTFEASSFSIYAVVYTVDFHYEVDGKIYDYSISGGGFISFTDLVEALGIANQDDPRKFVENVESVTFSSPELLSVSNVKGNTTIGEIKDALGLECEYSLELTEEQIAELNSQMVDEGDWALISLAPFDSEESLTVTMKNGDSFVVRVADAQQVTDSATFKTSERFVIAYVDGEGKYTVLTSSGAWEKFDSVEDIDFLDSKYLWRFYYVFTEKDQNAPNANYEYYFIRPLDDLSKSIALIDESDEDLIQTGANNIAVIPQGDGTYVMEGYSSVGADMPCLYFNGTKFLADMENRTPLTIFTQDDIKKYQFTVRTADPDMGLVYGKDKDGVEQNGVEQFVTRTKDSGNNNWGAQAKASDENAGGQYRYLFDYFDLNGQVVPADQVEITNNGRNAKIGANNLEIPYNGSILTAHFKQNPDYVGASKVESLEEWVESLKNANVPLDEKATKKTAEVYDYENRIYRVDLTTKSSLSSFTGTVDLGLILDVSGSMLFPSKLVEAKNTSGQVIGTKSIRTINDVKARDRWGNPTRYAWQDWGLDSTKEYYVIAEATTKATVFRLFYDQNANAWYRVDASSANDHGSRRKVDATTVFGADNTDAATTYPIYASGDDDENGTPITRSYYEKESIDNTARTLNEVLKILNIASQTSESPNVRAAWNTYAAKLMSSQPAFVSLQDHSSLSIDYSTLGGTRTDKALTNALTFNWGDSNTKYAILITDGAPQFGSTSSSSAGYDPDPYNSSSYTLQQQTAELVRRIKEIKRDYESRGIKLITVGLSMKDVEMGTQLLYDIADTVNGKHMFFQAESGDELENVLLEIVKNFILPCNVYGNVTDTVAEAFYPVDRETGKPLKPGDHISLNGDLTEDLTGAYGTVQADGRTIKWENQAFTPEGWHGSIYVKAKEDLLGGNMLPTNSGDAVIEAKEYSTRTNPNHKITITSNMDQIVNPAKFHPVQNRETPLVNVNELSFLHDETEWTVYLGTGVDPKNQLKRLYDDILIEEVIKKNKGQDTDGDGLPDKVLYENGDTDNNWYPMSPDDITDDRESQASSVSSRNSFYMKDLLVKLLKELISNGDTTRSDWSKFITKDEHNNDILDWDYFLTEALKENGIVIPYHEYGITDDSNIKITLVKEIVSGEEEDIVNKSPHATTVKSSIGADDTYQPVEKYTLTVLYSPDYTVLPRGQGGSNTKDYHAGIYGTMYQGHAAGTETSRNTHKINVFAKGISITKTDESFEEELTGAVFNLYRTARDTDTSTETVAGLNGQYKLVARMDLTANATYKIDPLEQLNENEKYYLVEISPPVGYIPLASPIEVQLIINDKRSGIYEEDENDSYTDIPAEGLFNWTQTARIIMEGPLVKQYDASGNDISGSGISADSSSDTSYFRIANNPGVELPAAGGPGTVWIYLIGSLLLLGSGIALVTRRRMRV